MSWNYRILAFEEKEEEVVLKICEVYYDENNTPNGYGEPNIMITTEGKEGLKWILSKCQEALEKPIIYGETKFPQEYIEH